VSDTGGHRNCKELVDSKVLVITLFQSVKKRKNMNNQIKEIMVSKIRNAGHQYGNGDVTWDVCDTIRHDLSRAIKALRDDDDVASAYKHILKALGKEKALNLERKKMYKDDINHCQKLCPALKKAIEEDVLLVQHQHQQQQQRAKQSKEKIKVTYHPSPAKRQPRPHAVEPKNVRKKDAELVQQHAKQSEEKIKVTYHPSPVKRQPRPHAVEPKNVRKKDAELVQQHAKQSEEKIKVTYHPNPTKRKPHPRS
jgi:hypothetical protein